MSKKTIAEQILDEEAETVWREFVRGGDRRREQMDYLENLRDTDFDEYSRQNGSDRLLELQRQGDS